jgi:hypothetical protein
MKPNPILIGIVLVLGLSIGCLKPKTELHPANPDATRKAGDALGSTVAGAIYGAMKANETQPPSNATTVVSKELGKAQAGLPQPTPTDIEAADKRVEAGLAGDVVAYTKLSASYATALAEVLAAKRKAEDDATALREEKKLLLDAASKERQDNADNRLKVIFGMAGAILTVLGGIAAAGGAWIGFGAKPGVWLLSFGVLVGTLAFVWGSAWFSGIAALSMVCAIIAAIDFYKQGRDTSLKQKALVQVVEGIAEQNLDPKKDPLLLNLDGRMNRDEKLAIKALKLQLRK